MKLAPYLKEAYAGVQSDHFVTRLFKLMLRASPGDLLKLKNAFPIAVIMVEHVADGALLDHKTNAPDYDLIEEFATQKYEAMIASGKWDVLGGSSVQRKEVT